MKTKNILLSLLSGFLLLGSPSLAQEVSPYQSPARPFNLDVVNPVMLSGSDDQSRSFNDNVLKDAQKVMSSLIERMNNTSKGSTDFTQLTLEKDCSVRTYFIQEGADWKNTLGFYTTDNAKDVLKTDAKIIFPDASSSSVRSNGNPLGVGDFVDMGEYKAGTSLDFFLIAKGATNPGQIYSTDSSLNKDGIVHAINFSMGGSTYLLISMEDIHGGGDKDYNDVAFVVEFKGIGAPEPSLTVMSCLTLGFICFRRKR